MGSSQDRIMHFYRAFGLAIASEIELPELPVNDEGEPDLCIRKAPLSIEGTLERGHRVVGTYEAFGNIWIDRGREIVIDPHPSIDPAKVRVVVLGPLLSIALRQRGYIVLHGGCAVVRGQAVCFLGDMGAGKSTTTAAFYNAGYSIMSDDVVAIREEGRQLLVYPGYPSIKLRPDAAPHVLHDGEEAPWLYPEGVRRLKQAAASFPDRPCSLRKVYLLGWGPALSVEPAGAQVALISVLKHTRALPHLVDAEYRTRHLRQSQRLVRRVPVAHLRRPRDLAVLPDVIRAVVEDVQSTTGPSVACVNERNP